LSGIFEQKDSVTVAPVAPAIGVLWKAEVMDEQECARPRPEQPVELSLNGLEVVAQLIEPARNPRLRQCLDLRAVVVGGYEHLVTVAKPKGPNAVPKSMTA